jgi:homogentisate 1,2-dioxygenase
LHNNWVAHGPDIATFERAREASLAPVKLENSIVFMIESRYPLQVTAAGFDAPERQTDYVGSWRTFKKRFKGASG